MPKSKGSGSRGLLSGLFGSSGGAGRPVTVIDSPVRFTQRRKAVFAFWISLFVVGLLSGTVASHYWHPILGALFGLGLGASVGAVLFALIVVWPVLRIIWWWLPEIGTGTVLVYGWTWLMSATPLWLSLLIVGVLAAPAAFRRPRQVMAAPVWCLTVRHRLRACFAAFIATNRQGTLPLILLARPTPAGERVWLWLRPGLSIRDLEAEGQVQKLAVACWASEVRVARASRSRAAYIRVDIVRREPLTQTVKSNLPDLLPVNHNDTTASTVEVTTDQVTPPGMNLADASAKRPRRSPNTKEVRPRRQRQPQEPTGPDDFDPSDYA